MLSAYLLSGKRFSDKRSAASFYKQRILRIMLPMWVYLLAVTAALLLIKYPVTSKSVLVYAVGGAGFVSSGVLGLGHFWYTSVLLICYFLVPILDMLANKIEKVSVFQKILILISMVLFLTCVFGFLGYAAYGVNIALFCFAFMYFRKRKC